MQLTMETFAQYQERNTVHVEIVAAAGASAECDEERKDDQKENPGTKQCPHGPVSG